MHDFFLLKIYKKKQEKIKQEEFKLCILLKKKI